MEMTIVEKRDLFTNALIEKGKKYGLTPHQVVEQIKFKITDDGSDVTFEPSIEANQDFVNDSIILYNTLFRGGVLSTSR